MDETVKLNIIAACKSGQAQAILRRLEGKPGYVEYCKVAIFEACRVGNVEMVEHLSRYCSHAHSLVNCTDENGETPLHIATKLLNVEVCNMILQTGACNINIQSVAGQTPLHLVLTAQISHKRIMKKPIALLLLSVPDCDPHIADAQGVTPLQLAHRTNHTLFIAILERGCAEGFSKRKEMIEQALSLTDNNLLHLVARLGATVVMRSILKLQGSPAIVNKVQDSSGDTPLLAAIKAECVETVEVLLSSQYCDPNVTVSLGDTPLIAACKMSVIHCRKGYFHIICLLLSNEMCELNHQNDEGNTALHIAAARGCEETVNYLVHSTSYKLDIQNKLGETPLHVACSQLNIETLTVLLKEGRCDVNAQTSTGQTPLHLVLTAKITDQQKLADKSVFYSLPEGLYEQEIKENIIQLLLDFPSCDPHIADAQGATPLQIAFQTDSIRFFALILEKGCEEGYVKSSEVMNNAIALTDNNLLHLLTHLRAVTVLRRIVKMRSSPTLVNKTVDSSGDTPLVTAIKIECVEAVEVLIESQCCDLNMRTIYYGDTPLIVACKMAALQPTERYLKIICLLLSNKKCDMNSQNDEGNTALHIAATGRCQKTVNYLVHCARYKPDCENRLGETPLHIACSQLNIQTVRLLLKEGRCDVNAQNNTGQTPLHLVLTVNALKLKESVLRLLLSVPACDPHVADAQGITPLQIAFRTRIKSYFMLILHGACAEGYTKASDMIEQALALTDNNLIHMVSRYRTATCTMLPHVVKMQATAASINKVEESSGDTPLVAAIKAESVEVVQVLSDSPYCNPNLKNASGDTPLIVACRMATKRCKDIHIQIISVILSNEKCDIISQNSEGDTALHIAVIGNCQKVVNALVGHEGHKPDIANNQGQTPLHAACACSELNLSNVATILQNKECMVNLQTSTGQTPPSAERASKPSLKEGGVNLLEFPHCNLLRVDAQGKTPLQIAYKRDSEIFALMLSKACENGYSNVTEVMEQALALTDNNLLHLLIQHKAMPVLRHLLKWHDSHVSVNKVESSSGDTPLIAAIKTECVKAVELLLNSQYCDPNVRSTSNGDTPLIASCKQANLCHRMVYLQMLLSNNRCDLNCHDDEGNTALHIAATGNCQEAVTALVGHKSYKPDSVNKQGQSPLHVACGELNMTAVASILRDGKCNINLETNTGQTPLHLAIGAQEIKPGLKLQLIQMLLSYPGQTTSDCSTQNVVLHNQQCDPNVRNDFGETPLHIAVEVNACDVLTAVLCNKHSDPNLQNNSGETPLHVACKLSRYGCVVALTESEQCNVNIPDNSGHTALHKAIYNVIPGQLFIIEHLISDSRCDLAACDLHGNTALHIACTKAAWKQDDSMLMLIRRLLSTGKADPQCVNHAGETPAQLAISNKKVYQELSCFSEARLKHPIQTFVKVFVVGNAETGKSTLIEAICAEASKGRKYVPLQFKTVKGVKCHTAGIVPIPTQSRYFGNAIFYDFAGQHEYYSSHAAVLENLVLPSPPVFIILVDLSKPFEHMLEVVAYWWSFIGSYTARTHLDTPPHVLVAGSHKDVVKARGQKVSEVVNKLLGTLDGLPTCFVYAGFTALNCKLVASGGLTNLRSLLKKTCHIIRKELQIDQRCHILSAFLQDKFPNCMACTLAEVIDTVKAEENTLLPQSTCDLLELLAALSDKDRILLLKNLEYLQHSWIILQRQRLYGEINGTIFAPEYFDEHLTDFARSTGVVPLSKIKKHFPQHHPYIITGFLSHLEFCFKIGDAQTLQLITDEEEYLQDEEFYFFPALVQVKNPTRETVWKDDIQISANKQAQNKLKYGWFYECSHPYQYLMTRFLHVLQFRLAFSFALAIEHRPSHNFPTIHRKCSVWKHGISWLNNHGIETVLEVGLQNQWVVLLMQCSGGMEVECARLRSAVVKIIIDTKEEFCPSIEMYESLLHPCNVVYPFQRSYQLSLYRLKEVAKVLVQRKPCPIDEGGLNSIYLSELLPFEPYTGFGEVLVTQLFILEYAERKITASSHKEFSQILLSGSEPPVERLKQIARVILPQVSTQLLVNHKESPVAQYESLIQKADIKTYQNLEEKLSSFSIFCGRNPLDLAGLPPADISGISGFTDPEHESLLEQTDDGMLGIESLLEVRTEVSLAVTHSARLGVALGLSQTSKLQVIQHNWPDDVEFQLTEIMAEWLQGRGKSSWRSLAEALLDPAVECPEIACAIMEQHNSRSSDTSGDDVIYQAVDGTPLDGRFPGVILPAVIRGGLLSWFHLGLVLGLHYGTLKIIQMECSSYKQCVAVMIMKWLNQVDSVGRRGHTSWRVLARALAHPLVGQHRLADDIARAHPAQAVVGASSNVSLPEIVSLPSSDSPQSLNLHSHSPPSSRSSPSSLTSFSPPL